MKIPSSMPHLKGFRFAREIIAYAVWAYHRFTQSTADVEDLLAERGVFVSRETVRLWVNRFGAHFAGCNRRDRPRPNDKWHLDEVVVSIGGVRHWLWRAVDADGDALDILAQTRRNAKAARRFMSQLRTQFGQPRVGITDKLRSYIKPVARLAPDADHRAHKGLNNRIEGSHRPTRRREKSWEGSNHSGNGIQFCEQPRNRNTAYSRPMRFDMICEANGIEHRLTKPNHPWTNGQVERMNRTIKDATVKRYHYDSHEQLRTHLSDFLDAYNYARRLKTLSGLTPYEYICKIWTSEPDRFILNPIHQMPGLNTESHRFCAGAARQRLLLRKSGF